MNVSEQDDFLVSMLTLALGYEMVITPQLRIHGICYTQLSGCFAPLCFSAINARHPSHPKYYYTLMFLCVAWTVENAVALLSLVIPTFQYWPSKLYKNGQTLAPPWPAGDAMYPALGKGAVWFMRLPVPCAHAIFFKEDDTSTVRKLD